MPIDCSRKSSTAKDAGVHKTVSTLGTGDAALAGYLYGVREHLSIQDSLKMANLFAGTVIKSPSPYLNREDIRVIKNTIQFQKLQQLQPKKSF